MMQPPPQCPLDDHHLYEFDLAGYTIFRGFIGAAKVDQINGVIDEYFGAAQVWPDKFAVLDMGYIFRDLMVDGRIMHICRYMLGDWFRFDHAYGLQARSGGGSPNLHAGPGANQGSFRYGWSNQAAPQCGLLVFTYVLQPVRVGDGGLVFVPGSHKQNVPIEGKDVFNKLLGNNSDVWWVDQPVVEAGDLIVFTEAVVHGTRAWSAPDGRHRRNLYYKYTPGHMCWRDHAEIAKYRNGCRSDLERDLLRPPFVARYDDSGVVLGDNQWRGPTRI